MRKKTKRFLSILLAFTLCIISVQVPIYAADDSIPAESETAASESFLEDKAIFKEEDNAKDDGIEAETSEESEEILAKDPAQTEKTAGDAFDPASSAESSDMAKMDFAETSADLILTERRLHFDFI